MSRGPACLRSQSARRLLERCHNRGFTEDAIIIDDDTENADIVVIDSPTTSQQGSKNASSLQCSPGRIINIDDEEDDPRNSSSDNANYQFAETFSSLSLSEDSTNDESLLFVGNENVCCDRTGPSRSRYGLYLDSESSMSPSTSHKSSTDGCAELEGSSSDCEIIEELSENIREQWEKAAYRKKCGQFNFSDHNSASYSTVYAEHSSRSSVPYNTVFESWFKSVPSEQFEETVAEFGPRYSINTEQNLSFNILPKDEKKNSHVENIVDTSVTQSCPSSSIPYKEPGNCQTDNDLIPDSYPQTAHTMGDTFSFFDKEAKEPAVKASLFKYENLGKPGYTDQEELFTEACCVSSTNGGKELLEEKILRDKVEQKLCGFYHNAQLKHEISAELKVSNFKVIEKSDTEEFSPFYSLPNEEPLNSAQLFTFHGNMDAKGDNSVDAVLETSIVEPTSYKPDDALQVYESFIGEREKYKETDEYKRAAEEEWALRQKQLQIQAEEAQRLRKRKKAENMRLLDMEKRQKQRLNEIRDLQKKDEETTQLKERIRTEIRKNLERVEMNCRDMASVLRALGIHVNGGHFPMSLEINSAYKQALLKFHPDRASRTDIRQQVEAEEKFKLISRLKEKLLF